MTSSPQQTPVYRTNLVRSGYSFSSMQGSRKNTRHTFTFQNQNNPSGGRETGAGLESTKMKPPPPSTASSWNRPTTTSSNLLPTTIPTTALLTEPEPPPPLAPSPASASPAGVTKKEGEGGSAPEPELQRAPLGLHAVRRRQRRRTPVPGLVYSTGQRSRSSPTGARPATFMGDS